MLDWIRNPVTIANIASSSALTCQVPDVPTTTKICNGIEVNELGLLDQCPFADFPWCDAPSGSRRSLLIDFILMDFILQDHLLRLPDRASHARQPRPASGHFHRRSSSPSAWQLQHSCASTFLLSLFSLPFWKLTTILFALAFPSRLSRLARLSLPGLSTVFRPHCQRLPLRLK